jgi:hypothetical protein
MIYGLLIDVDFSTGNRAGGIDPRDKNLVGSQGWQSLERGKEVRVILDGNPEPFRRLPGVVVLNGDDAIDTAVSDIQEPPDEDADYVIVREALMIEHIRQAQIDIRDLGDDPKTWPRKLHGKGCVGIVKRPAKLPPTKCSDFAEALGLKGERFKQNAIKRIEKLRSRSP